MALTNQEFETIKAIIAQELAKATSLQDAATGIAKGVTQYIGARYVPLFANPIQWDNTREYEPLTIVLYQGNSYTTRQYTPAGVDISNEQFWAETGNYNAQVEQYRQEVLQYKQDVDKYKNDTDILNKMLLNSVNVLQLGFDNTGTEDISELFNKYTQEYALYFPKGTYRVSKPLYVYNNIFGDCYNRYAYRSTCSNATFVCDSDYESTAVININQKNNVNSVTLANFSINGNGVAQCVNINIASTSEYNPYNVTLDGICAYNFKGKGIYSKVAGESRGIKISNTSVWNSLKNENYDAIGINIENTPDAALENIEIMASKIGLRATYCGYLRLENAHFWTYQSGITESQWKNSICIESYNNSFTANQLYFDTAYTPIVQQDGCATVSNVFIYDPLTYTHYTYFYAGDRGTIAVDNLLIEMVNNLSCKLYGDTDGRVNVSNAYIMQSDSFNLELSKQIECTNYRLPNVASSSSTSNDYVEIARIKLSNNAFFEFDITTKNGYSCRIHFCKRGSTINQCYTTLFSGTAPNAPSFKLDDNVCKVYIKDVYNNVSISNIVKNSDSTMLFYDQILKSKSVHYEREVVKDNSLTSFTEKVIS